jgi:hypothetical protein
MAVMTKMDATTPKGRRAAQPEGPSSGKEKRPGRVARKGAGRDKSSPESFVPSLPSINILPPAVTERQHVERLRRSFAIGAVLAVAAVGAGFTLQSGAISSADQDLAAEEARSAQLSAQASALAPVRLYYATVEANETTIQQTMSREVLLSNVVGDLYATAPPTVDLGTVAISVSTQPVLPDAAVPLDPTSATSASCPSPDPYVTPGESAGCVTITGTAASRAALGDWERQIGRSGMFSDLFISSSAAAAAEGPDAITFSASVSITAAAYLNRYADPGFVEGRTR